MKHHLLFAAALAAAFASAANAQVQVIDSSPESGQQQTQRQGGGNAPVNQQAELFYQLQTLQQEVMNLRGLVEEQAFEIKRLKQQRLDDYLDLDRRISALTQGQATSAGGQPSSELPLAPLSEQGAAQPQAGAEVQASASAPTTTGTSPGGGEVDEADVYGAAYDLLKQRQIDASIAAFKDHLAQFPQGEYASNSYYWLGEIYLLKSDLAQAQQWFGDLLAEFPDSRKVPDAQFKLGKVYHLQGNDARAKELLSIVAASSADASRLAEQYLQDNF